MNFMYSLSLRHHSQKALSHQNSVNSGKKALLRQNSVNSGKKALLRQNSVNSVIRI